MTDERNCKFCIHRKLCAARESYDSFAKNWNEAYPFVPMESNGDFIAGSCKEFKTLSDVHIPKKDESFTKTEKQEFETPSRILMRVINALDKLDHMSQNSEQYAEEEIDELYDQTNDLAKKLSDEEWDYAKNYASHTRGLNQ